MNKKIIALAGIVLIAAVIGIGAYQAGMKAGKPQLPPHTVVLNPKETSNEVFGQYYPREYESYLKNYDMSQGPSVYGGSHEKSNLDVYPYMKVLWKGYGFAEEYLEDRGHVYAIEDVKKTKRNPPRAVCWVCKSTEIPQTIEEMGDAFYSMPFKEAAERFVNPIGCSDCHDPETMSLRITRPALVEALEEQGINIAKASLQEMRSYVCAQCHVEYYFETDNFIPVFPWKNGMDPEDVYEYYQEIDFADFTHPDAGTKLLKGQHPDFEMFTDGPHQSRGVSCADCHMPYVVEGNTKISSHWWTSPLKQMENSCGVCHRGNMDDLRDRVLYTQDRNKDLLDRAGQANVEAVNAIAAAGESANVDEKLLEEARALHREGQWYWDWVSAENSMGFHNPQKAMNTLGKSIDLASKARDLAKEAAR